jgi:hypothetical protein
MAKDEGNPSVLSAESFGVGRIETEAPSLIVDPRSGDAHRADDILGELCSVMRKYGYGMAFDPINKVMVLGKLDPNPLVTTMRAIAIIERVMPTGAAFRLCDWTPASLKGPAQ